MDGGRRKESGKKQKGGVKRVENDPRRWEVG